MWLAVCDDQPETLEKLNAQLKGYAAARPNLSISADVYTDSESLLARVQEGMRYDIYLLDVLMPRLSGIELGRRIRALDDETCIAFLTSSTDYALEAFSVNASQYLLKPVDSTQLYSFLDRQSRMRRSAPPMRSYVLKTKQGVAALDVSDILFVECRAHKLYVTLHSGEVLESTVNRVAFSEAAQALFADSDFIQPHKSFLCNMQKIRQMTSDGFIMENGSRVPVAKNSMHSIRRKYLAYLAGSGDLLSKED